MMSADDSESSASARRDEIAVVTVNWNGWELSLKCLASLRRTVGVRWRLYLVDNASTDESADRLSGLGKDVTLLQSQVNSGWSGGNNLGVRHALAAGHDSIFLMNNDAEVLPDTLERLRTFALRYERQKPIIGPVHRKVSGAGYDFVGADTDPLTGMPSLRDAEHFRTDDAPEAFETVYIRGAGLFTHREHYDKIGFFDDRFYLNYDETDWCYRAAKAGYQLLMLRDATILHVGSATIGGGYSPLNIYFMVRNGLLFAEEHLRPYQRWLVLRSYYDWARLLPRRSSRVHWTKPFFVEGSQLDVAFRSGLRDYLLRRFGDCPPSIRTLGR